jgi:hypothetical protein
MHRLATIIFFYIVKQQSKGGGRVLVAWAASGKPTWTNYPNLARVVLFFAVYPNLARPFPSFLL